MAVVTVERIGEHDGQAVTLRGWLAARRSSGKVHFLQLRDGTGTIQCVMGKNDVPEDVFAEASHLAQETSLELDGTVRADARSPLGFELGVSGMRIVAKPVAEFPISPKDHGTAFLLEVVAISIVVSPSRARYALRAIHQDEDAAAAMGVNTTTAKTLAFTLSGAITGGIGAAYAFQQRSLYPNPLFDDSKSYWVAPNPAIGNFGWASVPVPNTGTTIRVVSVSAQDGFMQIEVRTAK